MIRMAAGVLSCCSCVLCCFFSLIFFHLRPRLSRFQHVHGLDDLFVDATRRSIVSLMLDE